MSKKNLKKYYKIFSSDSLESLESKISDHLSKGYDPIGGLTINNGVFYQALYGDGGAAGKFDEVIEIARSGEKLKAVKMYKEMMGVDLRTAKDWVDSNC